MFNKMNTNINISFNDVKTTIKIFDNTMYKFCIAENFNPS